MFGTLSIKKTGVLIYVGFLVLAKGDATRIGFGIQAYTREIDVPEVEWEAAETGQVKCLSFNNGVCSISDNIVILR